MKPRALVLAGHGLNCDWETAHALNLAGAAAERVHISDLCGAPGLAPGRDLADYQILVFDGGFSWGDDHGAGLLLANHLRNHLGGRLKSFLERGGLVLGICNGFQALVNLGLLPMIGGWQRQVALAANDCGNFSDRWVELMAEPHSPCLFTAGLEGLELPVRHGEGKLVCDQATLQALEEGKMVALRYAQAGRPAGGRFPANPNGSLNDIAGICDPSGRVFGLMPHPEGFYRVSQHPDWTLWREKERRRGRELPALEAGKGLAIFSNAVAAAQGLL